jgi:hypothetical protein
MLPDFKRTKQLIGDHVTNYIENRTKFHMGGFGSIGKRILYEGSGFITEYEDGMRDDSDLQKIHSSINLDIPTLLKDPYCVFTRLDEIAADHAAKQVKMIVDKISDATEKIGNVIDFRGQLTPDKVLEALDKVSIDFTPDGNPTMPSLFAGSEVLESAKKAFEEIHKSPDLTQRMEKIINNQRQRWYDRAANRKLVD